MARYTGPKTKIARKFGEPIFGADKSFEKRNYPPGQHGNTRRRGKKSEYAVQLMEKQKAKYSYGILERQFRILFERANRSKGVTGEVLLQLCESRLDNVVYRLGIAPTRSAARQLVSHRHIIVNGTLINVASAHIKPGDVIGVREKTSSRQVATQNLEGSQYHPSPPWVEVNVDSLQGTVTRLPQSDELEQSINVQLVVEFYSR